MGKPRFFGKNKSNSNAACHALPLDTLSTGLTSNMSRKKCATESCSDAACERSMLPVSSAPLNAALCLSCNVSVLQGNYSDDADCGRKGSVSFVVFFFQIGIFVFPISFPVGFWVRQSGRGSSPTTTMMGSQWGPTMSDKSPKFLKIHFRMPAPRRCCMFGICVLELGALAQQLHQCLAS